MVKKETQQVQKIYRITLSDKQRAGLKAICDSKAGKEKRKPERMPLLADENREQGGRTDAEIADFQLSQVQWTAVLRSILNLDARLTIRSDSVGFKSTTGIGCSNCPRKARPLCSVSGCRCCTVRIGKIRNQWPEWTFWAPCRFCRESAASNSQTQPSESNGVMSTASEFDRPPTISTTVVERLGEARYGPHGRLPVNRLVPA